MSSYTPFHINFLYLPFEPSSLDAPYGKHGIENCVNFLYWDSSIFALEKLCYAGFNIYRSSRRKCVKYLFLYSQISLNVTFLITVVECRLWPWSCRGIVWSIAKRTATNFGCQNSVTPTLTNTNQVDENVPHMCFYTHLYIFILCT